MDRLLRNWDPSAALAALSLAALFFWPAKKVTMDNFWKVNMGDLTATMNRPGWQFDYFSEEYGGG